MRPELLLVLFLAATPVVADSDDFDLTGHTKFRLTGQTFPDDSVFRDVAGSNSTDLGADLRLNLEWGRGSWSFETNYQLIGLHGDQVDWSRDLPQGSDLFFRRFPNDDRRLFNLTDVITDSGKSAVLHRLDRLWLAYTGEKTVARFGRQALSWGNGLFYAPMDLVNPFDPATIDTEYKAGDDMLYLQYLRDNGDDLQSAVVFRRELLSGDVESDQATIALKYHGFAGGSEYDLLVAETYGDSVIGLGFSRSIGGAVWGSDVVVTDTARDTYVQFVTNLTYSWIGFDRNMSGAVEYFYNGFGQSDGRYDPLSLAGNPDLLLRLARGELFTIARHYIAGSIMIEMTPLWIVTPTLLANAQDPSALFQLVTSYSIADEISFLGSINVPLGSSGSEFGGVESTIPGRYFSSGPGLFAQVAWYF
jgi:hypothetical protein